MLSSYSKQCLKGYKVGLVVGRRFHNRYNHPLIIRALCEPHHRPYQNHQLHTGSLTLSSSSSTAGAVSRSSRVLQSYYNNQSSSNYPFNSSNNNAVVNSLSPSTSLIVVRYLHSTRTLGDGEPPHKPSSKVEETAKTIEEKIKEKEKAIVPAPKRPLWKRVQDEILHYYHGFRLLFIDVKISVKLIWKILNGKGLSRREHKQLIRTTSDVFRLVPFSVFIIVPFMELLLPVFLKLFPGMLPSTFQTKADRETKMKAELKVKLDMAKFLQETLDQMAPQAKGRSSQTAKEFAEFINKIRSEGSEVGTEEIMKFSKLFEDEITLDSLSYPQLVALCRLLEIPAYGGTMTLLQFQLRMRLRNLAADDLMIEKEGVDSLNYQELQAACKARGMRAVGVTDERLKRQLQQWLQLSLHQKVPPSLLLLSRAMYVPENLAPSEQLQATLSVLPEGLALQTKAAIGEREGKVEHKTRIELIKEEERKIKEELEEAKKRKTELEEKEKAAMPSEMVTPIETEPAITSRAKEPVPLVSELGPDVTRQLSVIATINKVLMRKHAPSLVLRDDKVTVKDFEVIEDAIERLSKDRKEMLLEKEELHDLKEEMRDYKEDVVLLEKIVSAAPERKLKVGKGAQRLFKKLNTMIADLESSVQAGDTLKTASGDTVATVATEELITAMRQIKSANDDPQKVDRIARVLAQLDDNKDGQIEIDDLVKVIEIIGRENVHMTSKQIEEIVSILAKEETLEGKQKDHKKETNTTN